MRNANYAIVVQNPEHVIINDVGPWDAYPTITNAAESVVRELLPALKGRRLFYYDSNGSLDELVIKDNRFAGFKSGGPTR